MNILLSNDDGIYAEGLKVLAENLRKEGNQVYVVAPNKERSGTGHGITIHRPLQVEEAFSDGKHFGYSVDGKPSDCVKLGYWGLFKDIKFDLVVSGINKGANLGNDVFYSGTVSAAAEGALLGIKAIAISLVCEKGNLFFSTAANFLVNFIKNIDKMEFPENSLLNINVPNIREDELKGFKYTIQGDRKYIDNFEERRDPRGNRYYWLNGEMTEKNVNPLYDSNAVNDKYVSISPLRLNLTDFEFFEKLNK